MAIFTVKYSGEYGAKYYEFKAEATESDINIANNTSKVTVNIYLRRTNVSSAGAFNLDGTGWSITIDGTTSNGSSAWDTRNSSDWKWLGSASKTITHNSDGSKSITISASHTGNSASGASKMGNASGSGTFNLTKIARYATVSQSLNTKTLNSIKMNWSSDSTIDYIWYSKDNGGSWTGVDVADGKSGTYTITGLTYNTKYNIKTRVKRKDSQLTTDSSVLAVTTHDIARLTEAANINIGSSHTIKWTNPSGAAITLKLCKTDNTTVIDYGTVTGTSKTITPTASILYALTPNSNTLKLKYILSTGSTGSSPKEVTFTVVNSNPTFSAFTYADVNTKTTALTGNNQIIVKGHSNIVGTISTANKAVAKNSATMKTYQMTIGAQSKTANYSSSASVNVPSSDSLTKADASVIEMYAIDSRQNKTKVTKSLNESTFKKYTAIKIASLTATRTGGVGSQTTLAFKAKYWNKSFGSVTNGVTSCTYKYKNTNASSYTTGTTTLTYSISGDTITGSTIIKGDAGADGFNVSNSYNIQLTIADQLTSATSTITLGSGSPAMAIYKDNVAIGQKYDTSLGGKLQVSGGDIIITKNDTGIAWKEYGYGDKFKIVPSFSGTGDNNALFIKGVTGGAGTNPTSYNDLLKITAASGNYSFKGKGYLQKSVYLSNTDSSDNTAYYAERTDTGASVWFGVGSQGTNHGVYSKTLSKWIVHSDGTNVFFDGRGVKTLTAKTHSGYGTNNNYLIDVSTLSYWNGAYSSSNQSNLQYCLQGPIQAKPTGLYANESGTTGTVTLSQSSAGFNYLEIYYSKNGSYYNCTKVSAPNGKKVCLDLSYYDASNKMHQLATKIVSISGTSISVITNNTGLTNFQFNNVNSLYNSNELTIHKVLGYK